jgi:glycosidase
MVIALLAGLVPAAIANHTAAPSSVTIAGNLQSELGCPGDWQPECAATGLAYDSSDQVWQGTFAVPAGNWEYKAALNGGWGENYGANAQFDGANIALSLASPASVKFYYSHRTHWITDNRNSRIVTAAGSFQDELGCPGDWQPNCLRSWLQDPDGDGTYTFTTDQIPPGNYEAKAALFEGWAENYPADNVPFSVGAGQTVSFSFVSSTNSFSINVTGGGGGGGASHDNDIWWDDLGHDSRDTLYRTPGGAVPTGTPVKLRLRAASGDLTSAQVRVWNDRTDTQALLNMSKVADDGTHEWWQATVPASSVPTIYWYRFIARDGTATAYYEDDEARTGGWGKVYGSVNDISYQLTVYDSDFETPDWVKNAVIYQIFPDRFRDGDPSNNPAAGRFFYNEAPTVYRSGGTDWHTPICDPRDATGPCPNVWSQNFYGGDLQGILDKLEYLEDLGVTAIYLNPIFKSPSNHKYDTTDFMQIDPDFGDLAKLQQLTTAMKGKDMRLILDGVFNHSSSDSIYFDRYGRYDTVGACESHTSPYRDWYYFTDVMPGTGPCVSSTGVAGGATYESWFGYDSLPKLNAHNQEVRDYFYAGGATAVGPYWLSWADGWRLDVAGDVDHGWTNEPGNYYWEEFRDAVREANPETYIVGEEWGMATAWTLGPEWDATMNYQLSSALMSFFRDTTFRDNDHNTGSSAGELTPITSAQLTERILNLQERYPPEAFAAMMNLLGSHDTNRPLFMLDHNAHLNNRSLYENPNYDWSDAISRLKGVVVLQGTLPGAPTVYYGDEVGLVAPPTYDGSTWQDDPYNRIPYPWLDVPGTPYYTHLQTAAGQAQLLDHYKAVFAARNSNSALRTGDLRFLHADGDVVVYGRKMADHSNAALVIVNRGGSAANVEVDAAGYLPAGTELVNQLGGGSATVDSQGKVTVSAGARSAGIFTASSLAAAPARVTDLAVTGTGASSINLSWSAASGAHEYVVMRSLLSGGGYQEVATTTGTTFTDNGLGIATTYHYVVVSRNSSTLLASDLSNEASGTTAYDLSGSWRNVQWPPSLTHEISTTNPTDWVYGQIWISGVTDAPGATPGLRAQVGWGPEGSTPTDSWAWFEMEFNTQVGNNDEFRGRMLPDQVGSFLYTTRYSGDGGLTWQYAVDGPDSSSPLRPLTVNASTDTTPPAAPELTLVGTTASSISLSWTAPSDTDLAGFELFRDGTRIAQLSSTTTSYVDEEVTTNETYEYTVKAYDTSFNRSVPSNAVTAKAENRMVSVTFTVGVPEYTPGTVYVTGSIAQLGPWNPGANPMTDNGDGTWSRTFQIPDGTRFEWKYTRGNWDTVEQWGDISGLGNRGPITASYGSDGTMLIDNTATDWGTGPDSDKAVREWRDPLVVSHTPAANATGVATDTTVVVNWSKAMNAGTTFSVSGPGGAVAGSFALSNASTTVTFTPTSPLAVDTEYTVVISGKQSAGGDNQQVSVSFSFTTAADTTAPTTSDVTVVLRTGGQASPNGAPTLVEWLAEDDVTAAEGLVHEVQRRQSLPNGRWSAWTSVGTLTGVESVERDESPLGRSVQYRVRTTDEAGNTGDWATSNPISLTLSEETAFTHAAGWQRVRLGGSLGNHVLRSATAGATATLAFTGDGLGVIMPTGAGKGTVELCVDRGTDHEVCEEVNLATFTPAGQRNVVATFIGLTDGDHVLEVRVISGVVEIDAALVSRP